MVEGAAQVVRGVTGLGQPVGGPINDPGRVGRVVGAESACVLFDVEPAAQLAEQLRQSTGHDGEFGDEPVEFGRFAQSALAVGEVDERADSFGGGVGVVNGGPAGDVVHVLGRSLLVSGWSGQWSDALPGDGLRQAHRLPGGLADVGVVQQPVNGGGGQGFRHQLVKANWNWHTFVWDQMLSELLILGPGVSAGFQGGSAVC